MVVDTRQPGMMCATHEPNMASEVPRIDWRSARLCQAFHFRLRCQVLFNFVATNCFTLQDWTCQEMLIQCFTKWHNVVGPDSLDC